jgi:hypothetical protein
MGTDEHKSGTEQPHEGQPVVPSPSGKAGAGAAAAARQARLAEELRRNLLRRKSQKRGRQDHTSGE